MLGFSSCRDKTLYQQLNFSQFHEHISKKSLKSFRRGDGHVLYRKSNSGSLVKNEYSRLKYT